MDDPLDPFGWNRRRPDPQIERARRSQDRCSVEVDRLNQLWDEYNREPSDELFRQIQAQSKIAERALEESKSEAEDAYFGGCLYFVAGVVLLVWVVISQLNR